MIDLVSTRNETPDQVASCARLLAAVIGQAISDASKKRSKIERRENKNLDAIGAIHFLFGKEQTFDHYASLIGIDADDIRRSLTSNRPWKALFVESHGMDKRKKPKKGRKPLGFVFSEMDRRRLRYRLFMERKKLAF